MHVCKAYCGGKANKGAKKTRFLFLGTEKHWVKSQYGGARLVFLDSINSCTWEDVCSLGVIWSDSSFICPAVKEANAEPTGEFFPVKASLH